MASEKVLNDRRHEQDARASFGAITGSHETYHGTKDAEYIKENYDMPNDSEQHKGAYDAGDETEKQILDKKKK